MDGFKVVNESKNDTSYKYGGVTLLYIEETFVSDKFRTPNAEQRNLAVTSFANRNGKITDVTSEYDYAHFNFTCIQVRRNASKLNRTYFNNNTREYIIS
jgi:hypothetical protein